jgi:hypothetical protein
MNTSKPINYNEELHKLANAEAAKVQEKVREFLKETEKDPDELESLTATYTLNALLINAYTIAAIFDIPVDVMLYTVKTNYSVYLQDQQDLDNAPIH